MKKIVALCLLAGMFSTSAVAMMASPAKQECERRCTLVVQDAPKMERYRKALAEHAQKQSRETDLQKLKQLEEEKADLTADFEDAVENVCTEMCQDYQ
ncbi:hypothetical protein AB2N08_10370 [Massilia aurea]|uniref:hypothetical protein n=1 Tax=Massilia aurea TaxID=373040 RepID=UPI0034617C66